MTFPEQPILRLNLCCFQMFERPGIGVAKKSIVTFGVLWIETLVLWTVNMTKRTPHRFRARQTFKTSNRSPFCSGSSMVKADLCFAGT